MGNVADRLNNIGIKAGDYRRGPLGKDIFCIGIGMAGDTIKIHEGQTTITVATNKRKRQAVLNVKEEKRVVKTVARIGCVEPTMEQRKNLLKHGRYIFADGIIRQNACVHVPNSTMKIISVRFDSTSSIYPTLIFNLEFHTRGRTKQCFLVGYDSGSDKPFICKLRNAVSTVEEAHKELLPKNVVLKAGYKRHGEWFFNPVNKDLVTELNSKIHGLSLMGMDGRCVSDFPRLEPTTHRGMVLKHGGKRYAIGKIKDSRKGRHKPLLLNGWYEIIRNNEVQVRAKVWD